MTLRRSSRTLALLIAAFLALTLLLPILAAPRALAEMVLEVPLIGAVTDTAVIRTAVEGALSGPPTVVKADVTCIRFTGAATSITGDAWTYLKDIASSTDGDGPNWTSLTALDLSGLAGLKTIGECTRTSSDSRLESVALPNGLEVVGKSAFAGCGKLKLAALPASVKSVGELAFWVCSSLVEFSMPDVTSLGANAFEDCTSLKTASLPLLEELPVGAFLGCTSLETITLPKVAKIGGMALQDCGNLQYLIIGNDLTDVDSGVFDSGGNPPQNLKIVVPDDAPEGYRKGIPSLFDPNNPGISTITTITYSEYDPPQGGFYPLRPYSPSNSLRPYNVTPAQNNYPGTGNTSFEITNNNPDGFKRVLVDGKQVDLGNYTYTNKTLTFLEEFLLTLSPGGHTVKIVFDDGEGYGQLIIPYMVDIPDEVLLTAPKTGGAESWGLGLCMIALAGLAALGMRRRKA